MRRIGGIFGLLLVVLLLGFTDTSSHFNFDKILSGFNINFTIDDTEIEQDEAIVVRVIDGDTISVLTAEGDEERVRLLLIDTPESVHPTDPIEKFGPESSEYAKDFFDKGEKVTLEIGEKERDHYGRLLAYVWKNGINFNKHMIEKGYARIAYVEEPNTKYIDEFREAEIKAKKEKVNIWSVPGYVTDDEFDMSVVE